MDPGESYTLCVDGDSPGSGLDISATSTLRDVRENFPVPSQFFFAVPPAGDAILGRWPLNSKRAIKHEQAAAHAECIGAAQTAFGGRHGRIAVGAEAQYPRRTLITSIGVQ